MNSIGRLFRLTAFGESHGPAMGGIIDGLPPREVLDMTEIRAVIERRRPGASALTSQRRETDEVRFLSGLLSCDSDGGNLRAFDSGERYAIALGTPVGFIAENTDARSADYACMGGAYRPSHADFTWECRYGISDRRGGGRSSGRETLSRVVAGAFALQCLRRRGVSITTRVAELGGVDSPDEEQIRSVVEDARRGSDSVGGVVECRVEGMPAGVGDPVFGKTDQLLGAAMLSIGAVKGVEFGMGFDGCRRRGSEVADEMVPGNGGSPCFLSNNSGGIQGGITNGEPIVMRVAVKPTPTIGRTLRTVDRSGDAVHLAARGRHDPSVVLRILPVVESMAAIVLFDQLLVRSAVLPDKLGAK